MEQGHRRSARQEMKFYHSGIGKPARGSALSEEFLMLQKAGVSYILADQFQLKYLGDYRRGVALDCGSYYAFKKRVVLNLESYLETARTRGPFDFTVALDAVGNYRLSHAYWEAAKQAGLAPGMIPVWQFGAPESYLEQYLDESHLVGIGGLAMLMREKNEEMRRKLITLCERWPGRFHIFGLNWLRCFGDLKDLAHSADSSKWLDGARKGTIIFHHTGNNHLAQVPEAIAIDLGIIDGPLSREERCIQSAISIEKYCNSEQLATTELPPAATAQNATQLTETT